MSPLREPTHIDPDSIASEKHKEAIAQINQALEMLSGSRAVEINVSGMFAESKIAWKLASYQHALLHRCIALANGASLAWNNRCILSAMLSARALMESVAVFMALKDAVSALLAKGDLEGLDRIAMRGMFASRDPEWIEKHPGDEATNVLTYIDKFDKKLPGARKHYLALCERCHPNYLGHQFMFARLDRDSGTIQYLDESDPVGNDKMLVAAIMPLALVESLMAELDDLVSSVAELQHQLSPVSDRS